MRADRLLILAAYAKTRFANRWKDRASLEQWQEKRMLKHLAKIRGQSSFYRELWGGRPLSDWRNFPTIDKSMMMEHFDSLNTAGISKQAAMELALRAEQTRQFTPMINDMTIGLSSGTSGNRGLFLVGREERLAWAGTVLAKVLPASILTQQSIAFFLRANSNLYGTVNGGSLKFEFYDLLDPLERHLQRLNMDRPTLLVAPPSMLRLLAQKQRTGKLSIRPQRIVSVAEVLEPLDRRYIEGVFNLAVHQVYQCTEGFLAATCSHGTLHLSGAGPIHVFPDYISRAIITGSDRINAYHAVLHAPEKLELSLLVDEEVRAQAEEAVRAELARLFTRLGCIKPELHFTEYHIQASDRKLRRVERRF